MSLRTEIIPFIDGNGFVSPQLAIPGVARMSDNGVLFSSEYYILLQKRGELLSYEAEEWEELITTCMHQPGLLGRAPGDTGMEQPDDYYGVLAAAQILKRPKHALDIYNWGMSHKGSFNSIEPSKWTSESFLWRQPGLLAAAIAASGKARWYHTPIFALAALVIATSCIGVPPGETDSRLLSWCLIQAVSPASLLCRLASKLWYARLKKDYPTQGLDPNSMRLVAKIYFKDNHPFGEFFID